MLLSLATVVIVAGVSLIGFGMRRDSNASESSSLASAFGVGAATPKSPPAPPKPTGPDPAELARLERQKREAALTKALKAYDATVPEFSVAILDRKTGARYSYRGTERYETASIVKVQVLACLLLRAQDAGRKLTGSELSLAQKMIRNSDNNATTALFNQLGQARAVTRSNARLGLGQTTVNSAWGATQTTADDQIKLLSELVDTKGPLDANSRKTALGLMTTVSAGQRWGVGAAAKAGETAANKNGWDTRSNDHGLWVINTVGRITGGPDVSIAVLSHGHTSMASGIAVVEKVAKLTRTHLKW
jgi:beta-lactamase class A